MKKSFNLSRFDFVTLRLFCAVAQSGSITKGAETCHLALSAASRRLSDFESATGSQLLERSKKGVQLTPAGHLALQHCIRLFQGLERFNSELSDYSQGIRGHVRLWANMSSLTEYLPRILHDFLSSHADIVVELEEQLSGDIARALIDGIADIGVLANETPMDGLTVVPFQTNELVLLCHASHPLAKQKKVDFKTCLQYDFVGLNQGSSLLELTSRVAEKEGQHMHLRVQVRSFDAMCHMIAAGLGIGVLPLGACASQVQALKLKVVSLKDPWAQRQLAVAFNPKRALSPSAQLLLKALTPA
ncbi:LysR family transcriptional regulator [Limnohabitans sp. INBF002]|uniref:LysR family transcriptional regulator n=1 Tax=Limnohabitans sp. INBF002 TaxID=2986280 RepID=UPI002376D423|nr:LysR family transcriptional regulator [Limnohabitans sp. INBF002]BDU52293.1 LysR family transcriptional regulator [Limnohabitans sp. INBF002]